jgi:RNA polymerase sigma-70 factor (ECF subfamily)
MRAVEVMPAWLRPAGERPVPRHGTRAGNVEAAADPGGAVTTAGDPPDEELVVRTVAGDTTAFDRLVERHQRGVYAICYRAAGCHEDAADLAQDTFLRAFRALGRFRGEASFATWVRRIALNVCRSHLAGAARNTEALPEPDRLVDGRLPPPDEAAAAAQRRARLRAAVARLPPRQRESLVLRVYHDLSYEEIAATLDRSVGTVKANVFFAMQKLRGALKAGRD